MTSGLSPEELRVVVAAGRTRRDELYWQRRGAELMAHPMFPPDEDMPACYRDWLKQQEAL